MLLFKTRAIGALAVVVFLPFFGAEAHAKNKARSVELNISGSFFRFDSDTRLENEWAPTALVGYNFTRRHGMEVAYSSMTARPREGPAFTVDLDVYRLGYTFNAYPSERIVSLFRFGGGMSVVAPDFQPGGLARLETEDENFMIYFGGGFRVFITEAMAVRLDLTIDLVDAVDGFKNPDIQGTGVVGVSFLLGGKASTAEEPAP